MTKITGITDAGIAGSNQADLKGLDGHFSRKNDSFKKKLICP